MKMATCKSLSLLLFTILINFFHLTVQKNTVPVSFPLTFAKLSKNAVASSPPLNYRSSFKYSMALIASIPIGTPPQPQQMVFDTGSQLSWIQCRKMKRPQTASFTFNPSLSSSFSDIPCNDSACPFSDFTLGAQCDPNRLCRYSYFYADGTLAEGSFVRENFNFSIPGNTPRVILGCTNKNDSSGAQGVLGMNIGRLSFISQCRVPKFSYCVPLKMINNNPNGSFYLGDNPNSHSFQYINLLNFTKSQPVPNFDSLAYTVPLVAISIGGENLNISKEVFVADNGGSGQTIIDSGSQYTFLVDAAYNELRKRVANLTGIKLIKEYIYEVSLDMCFNGTSSEIGRMIGDMVIEFENGVEISIPKERTLDDVDRGVSCFAIGRSSLLGVPSNIIGNFHQQNLWVEFDVKNQLVGLGKADCSKSM